MARPRNDRPRNDRLHLLHGPTPPPITSITWPDPAAHYLYYMARPRRPLLHGPTPPTPITWPDPAADPAAVPPPLTRSDPADPEMILMNMENLLAVLSITWPDPEMTDPEMTDYIYYMARPRRPLPLLHGPTPPPITSITWPDPADPYYMARPRRPLLHGPTPPPTPPPFRRR